MWVFQVPYWNGMNSPAPYLSLVTPPGGHPDVDDFRIRVVLEPLALPWPVTFYFTEAVHEDGATVFICEGSEHGAAVGARAGGARCGTVDPWDPSVATSPPHRLGSPTRA